MHDSAVAKESRRSITNIETTNRKSEYASISKGEYLSNRGNDHQLPQKPFFSVQKRTSKAVENNQMGDCNQPVKIDWMGGQNIQAYIKELKTKLGHQGFRSKSQEKGGLLLQAEK